MTYELTPKDITSISDVECAFATTRLLPDKEEIPREFWQGNLYTETVEAIFYGQELPKCVMALPDNVDPEALNRCIRAHLQSFSPKHEHKIAGVAFMLSQACSLFPESEEDSAGTA